jgi:hypothetical protein
MKPRCPGRGEPVGTYEPVWVVAREAGAELTSRLQLGSTAKTELVLWHAACAEATGSRAASSTWGRKVVTL